MAETIFHPIITRRKKAAFWDSVWHIQLMPPRAQEDPPPDPSIKTNARGEGFVEGEPETKENNKNPHAVALGRLGGKKGGKARALKLTPEQRQEIARKAAQARWAKKSKP